MNNGKSILYYMVIFAVVLFSRISRVRPSQNFHFNFMSLYIAKLRPHKFPHLLQNHENISAQKLWHILLLLGVLPLFLAGPPTGLTASILFSSPYDLPPPRLPSSVALLLPLPLLPSSFPSITVRYKLFPLIMCPSHFFFLFFNVLDNSLSTPISCSTLSVVLFISHVILAILLHNHISNALSISSSLFRSVHVSDTVP